MSIGNCKRIAGEGKNETVGYICLMNIHRKFWRIYHQFSFLLFNFRFNNVVQFRIPRVDMIWGGFNFVQSVSELNVWTLAFLLDPKGITHIPWGWGGWSSSLGLFFYLTPFHFISFLDAVSCTAEQEQKRSLMSWGWRCRKMSPLQGLNPGAGWGWGMVKSSKPRKFQLSFWEWISSTWLG